jgi:RND family efflux transporter MFP subunit
MQKLTLQNMLQMKNRKYPTNENQLTMKNNYLFLITIFLLGACGQGGSDAETKKKELEAARKEYAGLKEKIVKLEGELAELDPEYAKETNKAILVSTFTLNAAPFDHKIEVRGSVASRKNVLMSAETPGTIQRVSVREGQRVSKGQVLVSLDASITRNTIAELKTNLELATSIFERQSKLWEQKIGTEVQYLQAKNNKESIERRLATANSQLDQAIIRAPFSGNVDEVMAREGELCTPGMPLLRITSQDDMYITADVSERFIGQFKAGDKVEVFFPAQDKALASTVASVSQVINAENRTFFVEVRLPKTEWTVKPNQVTILHLTDYSNKEALTVPTRLIQNDDNGQFIFKVEKEKEKHIAKKVHITSGATFNGRTELVSGIESGALLVDKGFRDLSEGVEVALTKNVDTSEVAKK